MRRRQAHREGRSNSFEMPQSFIVIVVIAAIVAFRVYRQSREQRWLISRMWITPAILLVLTLVIAALDARSSLWVPLAAVLGLAAGIGIGLYQGTHTTVRVDKAAKCLYVKVSPIGTLIFIGVLALRIGAPRRIR